MAVSAALNNFEDAQQLRFVVDNQALVTDAEAKRAHLKEAALCSARLYARMIREQQQDYTWPLGWEEAN
eukprot:2388486-Amphidinium_carterae.1